MRGWILGTTLQIALLVATFFWDELGTAGWHHVASLAIVLALTAASGRRMLSRRFLGIGVLVTPLSILAIATIFALETLVAFIQAYVFTILTCVYLKDALHPAH